jgi:predicted transposase YdaD
VLRGILRVRNLEGRKEGKEEGRKEGRKERVTSKIHPNLRVIL